MAVSNPYPDMQYYSRCWILTLMYFTDVTVRDVKSVTEIQPTHHTRSTLSCSKLFTSSINSLQCKTKVHERPIGSHI